MNDAPDPMETAVSRFWQRRTVWDHHLQRDEVIAPSVKAFVSMLVA